ncbi:transposase-like zinc-binding domain-containing protein [Emticicia sp. 17c]|uniref:transposase-like zinc-binding domain-containing protein n=1 Tax=Emticicia sp. 17c TaxID=3127704 RepID=UPI003FA5EF31
MSSKYQSKLLSFHSTKVVKNGIKTTGRQNFLCHSCSKQFHRTADAVGIFISRSKSIDKIPGKEFFTS